MILLHKGGSKLDLGNYRPIYILSPIRKIFETILLKRLVDFWEKYNLFTNYQFDFKKLHSTNLAINYLRETILKERDVNNSVYGISFGFCQSFWLRKSNQILHYTHCNTPKRITSWRGPSPRHCARATQLLSKKCHSGGEPLATLCPTWTAQDLNLRPPAPETNALPLDQLASHA